MQLSLQFLRLFVFALAGLVLSCVPAYAQQDEVLEVLILNSYDESTAPYYVLRNTFMLELQKKYRSPIAFRQFDLEQRSGDEMGRAELKSQLLHHEYSSQRPDLVVGIGPPATAFWLNHRAPVFSDVPFIAVAADFSFAGMNFLPGDTVVVTHFSFPEVFGGIFELLPDTSHVLMILGASSAEDRLAMVARHQLKSFSDRVNFEYTNDMKLSGLQNKLAGLQPGSVVFYILFDSDVDGVQLNHDSGLRFIRSNSAVPVFGPYDDQLGEGIIGGRLIQLEKVGKEMALQAQEVVKAKPTEAVWKTIEMSAPTFDWQELKAWNIDSGRLPDGSIVLYEPPGIWEEHGAVVTLVAAIILAQVVLISLLSIQHRRRRRAEKSSVQLGRRLISAQEDERRLLARELHDDLSQRLARVAIDTSYVASQDCSDAANEVLKNLQPELVQISKDVHDMSYRLHPSLIDDLGLVAALQTELERLRRYTDARVVEQIENIPENISPDLALCLYRISQEALNNAVKYANATTIEVSLEREWQLLILTVRDDGIGFDTTDEALQSGLGLSSMRERAQLAGGSFKIRSQPGKGTTVSVTVPFDGVVK